MSVTYDDAFYKKKLEQWEESLLDLSKRNKLLNLKTGSRSGALAISRPGYKKVWGALVKEEDSLRFPLRTETDFRQEQRDYEAYQEKLQAGTLTSDDRPIEQPKPFELRDHEVIAPVAGGDQRRRLSAIRKRANQLRDERGVDALYLAFGVVHWKESESKDWRAPIVLLPVSLTASSRNSAFHLKATGEEAVGNSTFKILAKRNYNLDIPEFHADDDVHDASDLEAYFDLVEGLLPHGWSVERTLALSVFSFATINMYYDLVNNGQQIVSHPVVRAICGDVSELDERESHLTPTDEVRKRADALNPAEAFQVVNADSSQEYAIQLANAGYSFVLQGPPGTGKSQTITNIIAESIARGKKVLFVSEKRAALDVVYKRLADAGLQDYVYVLHDVKQNKKEAIKELARQLDAPAQKVRAVSKSKLRSYERSRGQLDDYAADTTKIVEPLHRSMWSVFDELVRLQDEGAPVLYFELDDVDQISEQDFADMQEAVLALGRARGNINGAVRTNPWFGMAPARVTDSFMHDALNAAVNCRDAVQALIGRMSEASELMGDDFAPRAGTARKLQVLLIQYDPSPAQNRLREVEDFDLLETRLQELATAKKAKAAEIQALKDACGRAQACAPDSQADVYSCDRITPEALDRLEESIEARIAEVPAFGVWRDQPGYSSEEQRAQVQELRERVAEMNSAREELLRDWDDEILKLDARAWLADLESDSGRFSSGPKRKVFHRNEYQELCQKVRDLRRDWSPEEPSYEELCDLFEKLDAVLVEADQLDEQKDDWERTFPGLYRGLDTDFDELDARIEEFDALCALDDAVDGLRDAVDEAARNLAFVAEALSLPDLGLDDDFGRIMDELQYARAARNAAEACDVDLDKLAEMPDEERQALGRNLNLALDGLEEAYDDFEYFFDDGAAAKRDDLHEMSKRLDACIDRADDIWPAARYAYARAECCKRGLEGFVEAAEKANLPAEGHLPAFEYRFYRAWVDEVSTVSSPVMRFGARAHDRDREDFCKEDEKLLKESKQRVLAQLSASLSEVRRSEDARTLRHEAGKKRYVWPVRRVFKELPELASKLKPCMMMSPLSVSTFLETRSIEFDLVVFDEASQVCTENAVGAISRGTQVVIAGDSHQLPPTSFFDASNGDSDDGDVDEGGVEAGAYDSVLEEAGALTSTTLNLHYRSQNESLISFSNENIYEDRLLTFPSSFERREGEGVGFEFVPEGVWLRGGGGNPKEAQRVAELVIEHFRRKPKRTLGVIAFGTGQERVIEEAVDELRRKRENKDVEKYFAEDRPEPFFIKNLENVQGDERDSIIISVGYGRDAEGRLIQNFGPINKEGGERRLNVAVTRARNDLTLVSSMRPDDVNPESSSRGPKFLHDYLEYAQSCQLSREAAEPAGTSREQEEGYWYGLDQPSIPQVEDVIETALVERGYCVDRCIGRSGLRIDMGVKRRASDGSYLLGIMLDGPGYAANRFTRDRERIQPAKLKKMGWTLRYVWLQDWQRDLDGSLEELLADVDELAGEAEGKAGKEKRKRAATPEESAEVRPAAAAAAEPAHEEPAGVAATAEPDEPAEAVEEPGPEVEHGEGAASEEPAAPEEPIVAEAPAEPAEPASAEPAAAPAAQVAAPSQPQSASTNWDLVNRGFEEFHPVLVSFVALVLRRSYGKDAWWTKGVLPAFSEEKRSAYRGARSDKERTDCIDVATALGILDQKWDEIFCRWLSRDCLAWIIELNRACMCEARRGTEDCKDRDAYHWLDVMQSLCRETNVMRRDGCTNVDVADRIKGLRNEVYGLASVRREAPSAAQLQEEPAAEEPAAAEGAAAEAEEPQREEAVPEEEPAAVEAPASEEPAEAEEEPEAGTAPESAEEPASAAPAAEEPRPQEEPAPAAVAQAAAPVRPRGVSTNWDLVNEGFGILRPVLVHFEVLELLKFYRSYGESGWWTEGVLPILSEDQLSRCQGAHTFNECVERIDMAMALRIIVKRWSRIFSKRLPYSCRTWAETLNGACVRAAQRGKDDCLNSEASRWLDMMYRICRETKVKVPDGLSSHEAADRIKVLRNKMFERDTERGEASDAGQPLTGEAETPLSAAEELQAALEPEESQLEPAEERPIVAEETAVEAPAETEEEGGAGAAPEEATAAVEPAAAAEPAAIAEPATPAAAQAPVQAAVPSKGRSVTENWDLVNQGFALLHRVLIIYVVTTLKGVYGEAGWWTEGVYPFLKQDEREIYAAIPTLDERINALDLLLVLRIIDLNWNEIFGGRLPRDCRTWAIELKGVRNREAHRGVIDCEDEDAYRWLDTMQRLCRETSVKVCEDGTPDGMTNVDVADRIKEYRNEVYGVGAGRREASNAARPQAAAAEAVPDVLVGEELQPQAEAAAAPQDAAAAPEAAPESEEEQAQPELAVEAAEEPAPAEPAAEELQPRETAAAVEPAESAEPAEAAAAETTSAAEPSAPEPNKYQFVPYEQADVKANCWSRQSAVYEVLRVEAPVHRDLVYKRLASFMGRPEDKHVHHYANEELNELLGRNRNRYGAGFYQDGDFFYSSKGPERPTPRCGGDRSFSQIAPEEIDAGVLQFFDWLVKLGFTGLPKGRLLPSVYGKFAPEASGEGLQEGDADWQLLEDSLERLEKDHWLYVCDDAEQTVVYLRGSEG